MGDIKSVNLVPELCRPHQNIRATYIWMSGQDSYHDIRSKDRQIEVPNSQMEAALTDPARMHEALPLFTRWSFDGSSTGQAVGTKDTEIVLFPVRVFKVQDPHALVHRFVVLCECFLPSGKPTPDNSRALAREVFAPNMHLKPLFGLEQEYFLMKNGRPLGWPENGLPPPPQKNYYCGSGAENAYGREIVDKHMDLCLQMGLQCGGTNGEVAIGQWEWQIGPSLGLECGDHMIASRWLYLRMLEQYSKQDNCIYSVNYEPKPILGDWNGSGMHCNFSTADSMNPNGGYQKLLEYIKNIEGHVAEDIACFGKDNDMRLSGKHETSRIDEFSWGIGTRGTSIRLHNATKERGFGPLEDRRPASNADPYLVTMRVFCSALNYPAPEIAPQLRNGPVCPGGSGGIKRENVTMQEKMAATGSKAWAHAFSAAQDTPKPEFASSVTTAGTLGAAMKKGLARQWGSIARPNALARNLMHF